MDNIYIISIFINKSIIVVIPVQELLKHFWADQSSALTAPHLELDHTPPHLQLHPAKFL